VLARRKQFARHRRWMIGDLAAARHFSTTWSESPN
jgi:hypothetical protein